MTRAFVLSSLFLTMAGCGGGPDCAIDTDCPFGQRCSADNACVPLGVVQDASRDVDRAESGFDTGPRDAGSDAGPTERGVGSVALISNGEGTAASHVVVVSFQDVDPSAPSPCTQTTRGACVLTECTTPTPPADAGAPDAGAPDAGAPDAGPPSVPSAGTVQVQAEVAVTIMPEASGTYMVVTGTDALWTADTDTVRVSAAGDTVPAFNGTIATPRGVTISSPIRDPMADLGYPSADVSSFTWDGAGFEGEVVVQFSKATADGSRTLVCRFDATAGSGDVTDESLAAVGVPEGGVSLSVSLEGRTEVSAGGYEVALTASSNALDSGGGVVAGSVSP